MSTDWREILHFRLAPLQSFDPDVLLTGNDELDGFIVGLAVAYNDLKGVHWMNYMLENHQPTDAKEISPEAGQWNGMRVGASRWLMALSHEILHAVARASELNTLKRPEVLQALRIMARPHQEQWKRLVRIAIGKERALGPLREYLSGVRNTGAFHFSYTANFLRGYRAHFVEDAKSPHNERAYVSIGDSVAGTRFFFADAAALRMYAGDEDLGKLFRESEDLVDEMHVPLKAFLHAYIKNRIEVSPRGKP
jgi:hypothetical protein